MIQFDHRRGKLKRACFAGSIEEILADLSCEISLIYGGLVQAQGEDAAEEFREMLGHLYADDEASKELQDTVFSERLTKAIQNGGEHECIMEAEKVGKDHSKAIEFLGNLLEAMKNNEGK